MAKRISTAGILTALALIFSYVETLIPFHFGIPGIKLGLANIVIVTGLYILYLPDLCFVATIRILVSGLLFGNVMSLIYSFAGGLVSILVMILLRKTEKFSVVGISIAGGVFHNVGQITAAILVTNIPVIAYYLPVLMGVGILTGLVTGFVAGLILRIFARSRKYFLQ